jgi:hypothetical protein
MQAKPVTKNTATATSESPKKEAPPVYIKKSSKEFEAFRWFLEENFKKPNSKSL